MSKNIMEQATNKITIIGKIVDIIFREGKTRAGQSYESATCTIRTTQTYNGQEETSEIPVSVFATQYTSTGKPSPAWKTVQDLHNFKTIQNNGDKETPKVRISGASLRENNFVTKSGQLVSGWQLNTSFINEGTPASDIASFNIDIFIMDMHDEVDREGDTTGRLIVKGGIVQYNGTLDVVEFIVEAPDAVDYISRNWNINDTVNAGGRLRVTAKEEKKSGSSSSWGEELPETSTRTVRELIITRGSDEPFDEDFAYDTIDIKKAFNVRKANIEQLQLNSQKSAEKKVISSVSKYSWE